MRHIDENTPHQTDDWKAIVDNYTAHRLDDRTTAVTAIDPETGAWLWLMRADGDGRPVGCACKQCAPHEQTGRLPVALRQKIHGVHRCGHPRRMNGEPCRTIVQQPGDICGLHRTLTDTDGHA